MKEKVFDIIHGKKVQILELHLSCIGGQLELSLKIRIDSDNEIFHICFYNVSRVSMQRLSMPMEIHGLEIISHKQEEWAADSSYEIHDFEDGRICFFCEDFGLV